MKIPDYARDYSLRIYSGDRLVPFCKKAPYLDGEQRFCYNPVITGLHLELFQLSGFHCPFKLAFPWINCTFKPNGKITCFA